MREPRIPISCPISFSNMAHGEIFRCNTLAGSVKLDAFPLKKSSDETRGPKKMALRVVSDPLKVSHHDIPKAYQLSIQEFKHSP